MNPDRWVRLKEIYQRLADFPPDQRAALVTEWCEGDEALRAEVEKLLDSPEPDAAFLEPPTVAGNVDPAKRGIEPDIPKHLGDYELLQRLGEGGMGYVYLARQISLDRRVALKLLPARPGIKQREVERFTREAQSAAKLHHPRIVRIHDVDAIAGIHYYAMDYIEGHDLAREIELVREERDRSMPTGRYLLPRFRARNYFPVVVELCADVAEALHHAHSHRLVHRDIKPQNILLNVRGEPFLVDFGLAKDDSLAELTLTGDIVGSPAYMSPEQIVGRRGKVDQRADVYSLGVVLYELLALRRPFEGRTSREILNNVLDKEPAPIRKLNPRVPRDLETICMMAISRRAEDRYADVAGFGADLRRFLAHEAIEARPPSNLTLVMSFARRKRTEMIAGSIAVLVLAALLGWSYHVSRRAEIEPMLATMAEVAAIPSDAIAVDMNLLYRARTYLKDLDARVDRLDEEDLAKVAAARDRMRRMFEQEKNRGGAALGRASRQDDVVEFEKAMYEAFQAFTNAQRLNEGDRDVDLIHDSYPRVRVSALDAEGKPAKASLIVRTYDRKTSTFEDFQRFDSVPAEPFALRPDYYRFVVVYENGTFRELTRFVDRTGGDEAIEARLLPNESLAYSDMVEFPAASFTAPGDDAPTACPQRDVPVHVAAFRLDPYEVSNARYRAFLVATGRPLPDWWPEDDAGFARIAAKPAVYLAFRDMQAFAEWCGKRLPTHLEIERASFGADGERRKYPWVGSAPPEEVQCNIGHDVDDLGKLENVATYLMDVDSAPRAASPEGVHHLLGNASETTESPAVRYSPSTVQGRPATIAGMDWRFGFSVGSSYTTTPGLHAHGIFDLAAGYAESSHRGFRCAKSADPEP